MCLKLHGFVQRLFTPVRWNARALQGAPSSVDPAQEEKIMVFVENRRQSRELDRFRHEFEDLFERFSFDRDWLGEREPAAARLTDAFAKGAAS